MTETVRLAKRVAELFQCSRSEATQYIEGGWVTVNDQVIEEPGHRIIGDEAIALLPEATLEPIAPVTLLLHKPPELSAAEAVQLIIPANLSLEDQSGKRFLKKHAAQLSALAALDTGAQGLQVYSQDWRIIRKLTEDAGQIEHEYIVEMNAEVTPETITRLNRQASFNGKAVLQMKVSRQSEARLRFAIKGYRPDLIPQLCKEAGLIPVSVKRIRLGRLPMGGLKVGQWRYLLNHEKF